MKKGPMLGPFSIVFTSICDQVPADGAAFPLTADILRDKA